MKTKFLLSAFMLAALFQACDKEDESGPVALDPDTAGDVFVDRFSNSAAHLFVRSAENGFPDANEPVNFDQIPAFHTKGLGPVGEMTEYYNFDVMSTTPAPIYALFREGEQMPVPGQLNIVGVIPGDAGYNDFWLVNKVTVPKSYVANSITSVSQIMQSGYAITPTTSVVNCPIVPKGSVASKRFLPAEDAGLTRGWFNNKVVYYFNFFEKELVAVNGKVPTSDIYVSFNVNPGQNGGGPPSGFKTEDGMDTGQTHNIPQTVPTDAGYSPLWDVQIYSNAEFNMVDNLTTALSATILAMDAAIVNCPIVWVQH